MAPRILALKVSRAFRSPTRKQKIFLKGQNQKTSRLPLSDPAMEKQMEAQNADTPQATQGRPIASWASILLDYFDQKARLLAVESKEASSHFIGLLVLLGVILVSSPFQCVDVWGFFFVSSRFATAFELGLERFDLRRRPYASQCARIFCAQDAAPEAGISD